MSNFHNFFYIFLLIVPLAKTDNRLPTTLTPTKYVLELVLGSDIFETNTFTGTVTITFNADPSNTGRDILLHSNGITVTSGTLLLNGLMIPLTSLPEESNSTTDILTITSQQVLASNNYVLKLQYTGSLRTDQMYGFYKSSYEDENGNTKCLATTQFESIYARRAFPCFDEPSFKATFDVSITYPDSYTALCNTPIKTSSSVGNGLVKTEFRTSPIMSTYLLAFIVSEFTCTPGEDIEAGVIPYSVCSREESSTTRQLAVDVGPSLIRDLEDFTGIKYSESGIGKMDQVAIPDFAAGAMENWGLVTYRETALLWDEIESSNRYKQRVATVVAHEFTHQWFGNLVTLKWWSDVFLNEGFATYFEFFSTHNIFPTWELDKQFVIEEVHGALDSDSTLSSSPLSKEVSTLSEISGHFGTISYSKGGSILRMVEHILGSNNFKTSVRNYLTTFKSGNTEPNDLWNALDVPAVLPPNVDSLADIMLNWTVRAGYPVLNVRSNGNDLEISQKRFLISGEDDSVWFVPISYTTSSDTTKFSVTSPMAWLTPDDTLTITNILENEDWIILNNQQTGFYRINYDTALWTKIIAALNKENFDEIAVINRAQIVDDLFNLAKINELTYSTLLTYLNFLQNDIDYYPWYAAYNGFSHMLQRTGNAAIKEALINYILNLGQKLYASVPFGQEDSENQIYTHKQVLALTWACKLGNTECISRSKYEFEKYMNSGNRPSKNFRSIIYCTALRNSDNITENWNFLWNEFLATKMATEQITILSALGCTKNTAILNTYLQRSINSTSGIRKQDALSVYSSVYSNNDEGVDIALNFLIENYQSISNYYTSMNSINNLIKGIAARFTNQQQITKLESLTKSAELSDDVLATVQEALATARTNLQWTEAYEKQLADYFKTSNSANIAKISLLSVLILAIFSIIY